MTIKGVDEYKDTVVTIKTKHLKRLFDIADNNNYAGLSDYDFLDEIREEYILTFGATNQSPPIEPNPAHSEEQRESRAISIDCIRWQNESTGTKAVRLSKTGSTAYYWTQEAVPYSTLQEANCIIRELEGEIETLKNQNRKETK